MIPSHIDHDIASQVTPGVLNLAFLVHACPHMPSLIVVEFVTGGALKFELGHMSNQPACCSVLVRRSVMNQ